jgi:voltage-gated potassium channel
MWSTLRGWLQTCSAFVRRDNLPKLFLLTLFVVCGSTAGLTFFESLPPTNALWWTIVTISTVGYGDITPITTGGRVIAAFTMLAGIGLLGTLTAALASIMIGAKLEGIRGMRPIACTNHFVICGWNYKAREICDDLRADLDTTHAAVVLIADLPEKPLEAPQFFFVRGEVTLETMALANMGAARIAMVLGDERLDAFSRDARTILTTLTIKTAYPHLYTCVELVEAKNLTHCQLARADEIIVSGALSSGLLVRAALDPGVTRVVSELLDSQGHELYLTHAPAAAVGKPFLDVLTLLKQQYNALMVAIQRHDGRLLTNPAATYHIEANDRLYLIAEHRPHLPV